MSTDLIRYDLLVQDAMRGVMRRVLSDVALTGALPGEHHFTITFRTTAPDVRISRRLSEQWPVEMTIILQYQFSNLVVDEEGFSVGLSFRNVPEQLYVPFAAVTGFFDPAVDFGLTFGVEDPDEEDEDDDAEAPQPRSGPQLVASQPAAQIALAREPSATQDDSASAARVGASDARPGDARPGDAKAPAAKAPAAKAPSPDKPAAETPAAETQDIAGGDSKIVSIDAFRKKH